MAPHASEPPTSSNSLESLYSPHTPDFAEERLELQRVLQHEEISRSVSLVRFLNFICQKYFEDRTSEIREHSIAVEALGRKESTFDSQVDPIVRVTARTLRKKLREYYDHDGRNNPFEIVIPLGRYIPQFVPHTQDDFDRSSLPVISDPSSDNDEDLAALEVPAFAIAAPIAELPAPPVPPAKLHSTMLWVLVAAFISLPLVFSAGLLLGRHGAAATPLPLGTLQWGSPVWADEFNGNEAQIPDPSKWTFDLGSQNSWGNHELENYCSPGPVITKGCDPLHPNAFLDGSGHLVLQALRNADGNWTSARITTRGLKTFQYGRIEARMKMPVGAGLWPAFWMLGANMNSVGWPAAGTVDIAENVGLTSRTNGLGPSMIRASLHGPGYSGGNSLRRDFQLPNGAHINDGSFHTYGIIWSPGMIQFYVDDPANIFFVQNVSNLPEGGEWVFDRPFYLVLNLAVGGDWAGDPDNTTPSPSQILVDYVRVYQLTTAAPSLRWQPVAVKSGGMASSTIHLQGQKGSGRVYLSCSTEPATVGCVLDSSTVDFTNTDSRDDTVTISTDTVSHEGSVVAKPGIYKLTLTATTISGDRSQLTVPFEVTRGQ